MKDLWKHTLFICFICFTLVACGSDSSSSLDFRQMDAHKVAESLLTLDSKIRRVEIWPYEGKEVILINYRAGVLKDPLLEESNALRDITEKVFKAKGSERFAGIKVNFIIPMVDDDGNKIDMQGAEMYWVLENLQNVDWQNFQNWQFIDRMDGYKATVNPAGLLILQEYCGGRASYAEAFCRRLNVWR